MTWRWIGRRMASMVLRTTGELVGREGILQQLTDALGRAAAGEPAVVVVSGETGVGKTRLVTEFMARASATTLAGACVPVAGEPLPYAALTQALRSTSGVRRRPPGDPPVAGAGAAAACGRGRRHRHGTGVGLRGHLTAAAVPGGARAAGPDERRRTGAARGRGRALGRPLDPRPAGVPGHEPHRRAGAGAADLPRGRPRRVPDARPVAGRARPVHHPADPGAPAGPCRRRTPGRRAGRPAAAARAARGDARALGGEPAVRRAARPRRGRRRRVRSRPRCTSCSGPGSTTCRATPGACSVPPR